MQRSKNGEEYEPATVSNFQPSIQRYLSDTKYPFNIHVLKVNECEKSRKVQLQQSKSHLYTSTANETNRKLLRPSTKMKRMRRGCPFCTRRIWSPQSSCASKNCVVVFIHTPLRTCFSFRIREYQSSDPLLSSTAPVFTCANVGSIS